LKSGGYLVINPTEALVSIDVNSGRATKERHIEETALNTNMEAAEEVARQLRLRDLGGLVVIDFIDMEDRRNNAKVERKLKESLSGDRARIQIGRISSFGLLELSRQRLNPSLTEAQYDVCKHCEGRGVVRNADSTSIMLLRGLEEEGIKGRAAQLIVHVSSEVALYMLNNKRKNLDEIERRYGFMVLLRTDDTLGSDKFRIEVARPTEEYTSDEAPKQEEQSSNASPSSSDDNNNDDDRNNKRKRGRRGGRGRGGQKGRNNNRDDDAQNNDNQGGNDNSDKSSSKSSDQDEDGEDNQDRSAQNKRGGRRSATSKKSDAEKVDTKSDSAPQDKEAQTKKADHDKASKPKPAARGRKKKDDAEVPSDKADAKSSDKVEDKPKKKVAAKSKAAAEKSADKEEKPAAKKAPAKSASKKKEDDKAVKVPKASNDSDDEKNKVDPSKFEKVNEPPKAKKKGWWNKLVD
jgi:ribonuclease E